MSVEPEEQSDEVPRSGRRALSLRSRATKFREAEGERIVKWKRRCEM
jgi:hypothetical protein